MYNRSAHFDLALFVLVGVYLAEASVSASSWRDPLTDGPATKISAEFVSSKGIKEIDVRIRAGELMCVKSVDLRQVHGTPSYRDAIEYDVRCKFDAPVVPGHLAKCPITVDLSDRYTKGLPLLISYRATADDGGKRVEDEEVTFAQGRASSKECLWPVLWHRESNITSKINLALMPEEMYGNDSASYPVFVYDASFLVKSVFFERRAFSAAYFDSRDKFNIWLAPMGAKINGCVRTFGSSLQAMLWQMDGRLIIHQDSRILDCADISLGGSGSAYGQNPAALMHESGHFLYGFGDEYDCRGTYTAMGDCKNVFPREDACQSYAALRGFAGDLCKEIRCRDTHNGWRIDDRPSEGRETSIMARLSVDAAWRLAALQCVQRVLSK